MATMKAVVVNREGGPEVLEEVQLPKPQRQEGQLLVRLSSTCVNPVDTYVRSGGPYAPKAYPKVLGGDVAGTVEEGDEGGKFKAGDAVFALTDGYFINTSDGSYCQYVTLPAGWAARVPNALPLDEAGGVPLVALTAWQALEPTGFKEGLRVLITGASGGVGHIAVQMAKAHGMYVVGVAGPTNQEYLRQLGCDETVDYKEQDAAEVYAGKPFDCVVDLIGGTDAMRKLFKLTKPGEGVYSHILNRGTDNAELEALKKEAAEAGGATPRVHYTLVQPNGGQLQKIADLMAAGKIKLHVQQKLPLERAADAHRLVETWHTRGKIVLTVA